MPVCPGRLVLGLVVGIVWGCDAKAGVPPVADPAPSYVTDFHGHTAQIEAMASAPRQGIVATGDANGVVYIWRLTADGGPLGAKLSQDGLAIGIADGEELPGPVSALAFGEARCDGPDNPRQPDCGLYIAGIGSSGFSWLRVYDWRRRTLLIEKENLLGEFALLTASPAADEVAGCFGPEGVRRWSLDYHRRTAAAVSGPSDGAPCRWVGYAGENALQVITDKQLRLYSTAGGEAVLDVPPQAAVAFGAAASAGWQMALAHSDTISVYGDRKHRSGGAQLAGGPADLQATIRTRARFGADGVRAMAWLHEDGGDDFLFVGGVVSGAKFPAQVTHQVERWRVPGPEDQPEGTRSVTLRGSNFSELIGLRAELRGITVMPSPWRRASDGGNEQYIVIRDGATRLLLVKAGHGYEKGLTGNIVANAFFALEARPYTAVQLRIGATGETACLWPGGGGPPMTFVAGRVSDLGCVLPRPGRAQAARLLIHGADNAITIAPATARLDFDGGRLQAYALSADGVSLYVALAQAGHEAGEGSELRQYSLRADRWAPVGSPQLFAAPVVALALSQNHRLGIATHNASATGGLAYSVTVRDTAVLQPEPQLKVRRFAPQQSDPLAFELCVDVRDPSRPLVLVPEDGRIVRIGAPAGSAGALGPAEAAPEPNDQARILSTQSDPGCAPDSVPEGSVRYAMVVSLPHALEGLAQLALAGERSQSATVNFSRPNLHVLAIGINKYKENRWELDYAVEDAVVFADLVRSTQTQIYDKIDVQLMTDNQATRANILMGLADLQRKVKPGDWSVIYFSGHAQADRLYNYYFLPWDFNDAYPHAVHISESDLESHLRGIRGKKVLVLDTCFAGNLANRTAMRLRGADGPHANDRYRMPLAAVRAYAERLMELDDGLVLLAASSIDQTARESKVLGHGVFTSALLDALRSPAKFSNRQYQGALTIAEIRPWLDEEVVRRSRDRQRPVITGRTDLLRAPFWQVPPASFAGGGG